MAENISANTAFLLGYDVLLLQQNLINTLIQKGILTPKEAQSIIDRAKKTENEKEGGKK